VSTPDKQSKRFFCAAIKRGTPWGTAVALGATDGILMLGDSGLKRNQKYEQYPAVDQIIPKDGLLGVSEAVEFTPPLNMQYELGAIGGPLAAIFGTAGAPVIQGAGPGYKHTFQYADEISHFFTYAEERPGKIWEVASAMPYKLSIKPSGAQISIGIGFRGNTLIDDSGVNGAAQMDAVTYADRAHFLHMTHGKFLMNAQVAGGALADPTDALEIADFEVSMERAIDNLHVVGGANIALPKEGDIPNNTLKIVLSRASAANAAYFTTWSAMTGQKAKLYFTGDFIGETYYYGVVLYLPRLRLVSPPDIKLEGNMKTELLFVMEEAAAAPAGMTYVRPYMEVVNLKTTDYLA
jgi:hypothetical protein